MNNATIFQWVADFYFVYLLQINIYPDFVLKWNIYFYVSTIQSKKGKLLHLW